MCRHHGSGLLTGGDILVLLCLRLLRLRCISLEEVWTMALQLLRQQEVHISGVKRHEMTVVY